MSNIPFEDNHFDFVFCSDVIGLVEDLGLGLKECARVLKPNGKALFYATCFKTHRLSKAEERFLDESLAGNMLTVEGTEETLGKHFIVKESFLCLG